MSIVGRAHIQAEVALTRDDVDRPIGYIEHANGGDGVTVLYGTLLCVNRELGQGGDGVTSAIHGGGSGVASHAIDLTDIANATVDGGYHAQWQVHLI